MANASRRVPINCNARAVSGFGQTGPRSSHAGHDINYIASTGLLHLLGGVPPVNLAADFMGGALLAVIGIQAALIRRSTTTRSEGGGCVIDVSMAAGAAYAASFLYTTRNSTVSLFPTQPGYAR